jgi:hypothetical protein
MRSTRIPSDDASSTGRFTDSVTSGVNSSKASYPSRSDIGRGSNCVTFATISGCPDSTAVSTA